MKGAVGAAIAALWLASTARAASPTFPFVYKYDDATASVTNLAPLLHAPAGIHGFVTVDGSGHLATAAGRQRFFGTNLTYQSNFPSAADAAKVAGRMAKFGINLVRFHHMDYTTAPAGIWSSVTPDRILDPAQVDKLDRFVFELKQKGIYSNINLAVSRPYNYGPTLHTDINLVTDGKLRQALAFFDPALLQLHKDYATDLLTHVNPYTGKAYTNEPALAFVEISNEVGLIGQWLGCALDGLPTFYKNELNTQWNDWLTAKYATFAGLKAAGFGYDQPLGSEMLLNPDFTSGTSNWGLDVSGGAAASWAVTMEGPTSNESAKVQITTPGSAAWNVSLFQGNLNVSTLTPYTVTFWAKASSNRTIAVAVNMNHAPWSGLGFYRQINLTTAWQQFTVGFDLTASDTNARLMFTDLAIPAGTVWISQVSMKPGGLVGLYAGENLDTDTMLNFVCNETTPRTALGRRDWITFLWEKEDAYWTGMRDHLKNTLGVKALIMGTAQSFSSANLMAKLDVVDTHAYWEHPVFPGTPWDPVDWYLNNTPMTHNQSNALGWANMKRVVGKPWSISEYNHPRPLSFDGEMAFFMAGYGAFQDYDAVYEFDYESWTPTFDGQKAATFFQMNQNPVKMATCLPAAAAFLRGDIAPATGRIVAAMSKATEIGLIQSGGYIPDLAWLGENSRASFVHGVAMATEGTAVPGGSITPGTTPLPNVLTSDTGELVWDLSVAGQGFVTLDTARSKWAWGTVGTRVINFAGGFTVNPGATFASNLAGVSLTALDGMASMLTARKLILTAVGAQTNTGQNYYQYPSTVVAFPPPLNIQLTSKNEWGTAPSIVEGVPATVTLPFPPSNVRVWSLTTSGARVASVTVVDSGGKAQFAVGSTFTALQYEIEVDHAKLEASLTAWPNVNTGSNFKVTLTITNTGTAAATGVSLLAPFVLNGSATVNPVAGPSPAMPYATIAAGASVTFTWTYNGFAPGTKTFTVTVAGTDSISGQTITAAQAVSNAVTIIDPVALLPSIKVNHFGWRPNDQKIAVVNTNPGATAVLHRAGDGSIAYSIPADGGSITSKGLDPNGNENVWQIDFSNFKTEGSYYLKVPSLSGNSDVFDIRENVYNRVGYAMLKSFYAQRCGTSHGAAYMGAGWADAGVCHAGDTAVDWNSTDDPGGVSFGNNLDLSGGWHDAGDYNKYIGGLDVIGPASWGGDNGGGVWGIAMGFEINSTGFKSDATGIPESGNGIPDALDEIRYEIDWFRKMQAGAGGSAVLSMCHAKAGVFSGGSPPSTDPTVRYYTGPTLESTACAGACFALGARLFAPYDAAYATTLTTAADNAWTGLPAGDDDAKFWFACELYRLNPGGPNGAAAKAYVESYFNYSNAFGMGSMYVNFGSLPARGNSQTAIRGLMAYTLATGGTASVITGMRSQFSQFVTTCFSQAGGYGSGLQDADYNWGSNAYVGSRATSLLHAARIGATGAKTPAEVRTQAQHYVHYLLGLNGPNMVYVSNVAAIGGEHSSYQFYHGWFGNYGDADGKAAFVGKPLSVLEPAYPYFAGTDSEGYNDNNTSTWGPFPGFVPGGANKRYGVDYGTVTPPAGATGNHYFYRDWVFCCSGFDSSGGLALPWTITENSLGYQGPCVAMVAAFMTPETLLTLSKTASGNPVNMEAALTYSIVGTSAGGGTAYSVSVWDTVPAGVTFGWASPGGVYDGSKVVWTLPNLAPGATYAVWFTVTVTSPGPVIGPNVASADYRDALAVQQPTVTTLPVSVNVVAGAYLQASIAVSVTTVIEGFGFLVSLTITNTGLATATDLFASPFAQSGDGSGALLWGPDPALPFSLAPGAWVTLTWSFTGSDLGTVRFTASPQGIDAGFGGAVATRATSGPVDIVALPGCPLLWNGAESFDNNGIWSGPNSIRTINWSVTSAITQGGASVKCDLQTAADWQDGFAGISGFTPSTFAGYTSLRVSVYADPTDLPYVPGSWRQMFLYADSAATGKFYQALSSTLGAVNPGMNTMVFTLDYPGTIKAGDALSRVFLVFQNDAGFSAAGNFYLDNFRLTGTMTGGTLAAAGARPASMGIGAWGTVTLTVTNTGSAAINGVAPSLAESIGDFRVAHIAGPVPPGPVDLLPGQAQTFAWTVSASGGGLVVFTPTATGGTCAGTLVTHGVPLTMTITGPAVITAGLNAFPSPRNIGQPFWVTMTVTNVGGATATVYLSSTIFMHAGTASSTVVIGPPPSAFPFVLAAGARRTFTWTLTGATSGTLYLTATVTGRDWLASGWLGPYVVTSNEEVIQTPAALTVSAYAFPPLRIAGQPFSVTVTVSNSGQEAVSAITFAGPLRSGPGNAAPGGGPSPPTPFTLPGLSATTFTWTYNATVPGWVAYTVTLNGTRANAGTAVAVGPRTSGSVYIVTTATLDAWVAAGPLSVSVGQSILVTVTVTNTGGTPAYSLSSTPIYLDGASTGGVAYAAGPTPVQSTTLYGGGAITFTWTFTATTPGWVLFRAGVSATDLVSGALLNTGVLDANGGVPVDIFAPADLQGSLLTAEPPALCVGEAVHLVMTLTNAGAASATAIIASTSLFMEGTAGAVLFAAPRPLTHLGPGGINAVRLTWSYTITAPGELQFTATVVGADANTGMPLSTGPRWSNSVTALAPGFLAAHLAAPDAGLNGTQIEVVLTLTNTGGQPVDIYDMQIVDSDGCVVYICNVGTPPSPPLTIPAGATQMFTWLYDVYTDYNPGDLVWSATAWGTTCAGQVRIGWDTTAATAAVLTASANAFPVNRSVGQNILVTLTVTNTGNVPANVITADPWMTGGGGGAALVGGPNPAAGGSLAAGAKITFTWTFTAAAPGFVEFTTTVHGFDGVSGLPLAVAPVVSNTVAIFGPAALAASLTLFPSPRNIGQTWLAVLTVTNTGGAAVTGGWRSPFVNFGTAIPGAPVGPTPAWNPAIPVGATFTYTWTYTGSSAGWIGFTLSVGGSDAVSGLPLTTGVIVSTTVLIQTPAALARQLVIFPGPARNLGQDFLVALTVTNTGQATAQSLNTKGFLIAGPGAAVYADGPEPPMTSFDLPGGASQLFTWTYTGAAPGLIRFSTTLTALDANTGASLAPLAVSNTILLQTGATLDAMVTLSAGALCIGQNLQVRLTVTNSGQASATLLIAEAWEQTGGGLATLGAGPSSATPFVLAGGATRTFTWTFTGSMAGPLTFSTTVSAVDVNSGTALVVGPVAAQEITVGAAGVLAVATTMPPYASVGQAYTVSLTVTNTGGTDVTGVTATMYANPGGALVGYQSAPAPPGPVTLSPGASQTFVWTRSALGAGVVTFTATGVGTTCGTTVLRVNDPVSATIQTAALLRAAISMTPTTMCAGQTFVLTLTVTNSGQAGAINVTVPGVPFAVAGTGGVSVVSGPYPPMPDAIPGLTTVRYTWTLAGGVSGTAILTTTVTGLDANSGETKASLPATRGVSVGAAGALLASVSGPATVSVGQWFQVRLTLTNTGGANVTGLTASAFLDPGTGGATWVSGASPPTVATLTAGSTTTFVWTYSASGAGTVNFSLTAQGSTVCGVAIPVIGTGLLPVVVQTPAMLLGSVAQLSDPVCVGQSYLVTLTVTNTGQANATTLALPAPPFRVSGAGNATLTAGPTPALPGSLAAGGSITLTWTFTGAAPGSVWLTATVTGQDANSLKAVTSGPVTSVPITVSAAASLAAAAAVSPGRASIGQWVTVTLTVTNTGGADATGVTATIYAGPGGALVAPVAGPAPAGGVTIAAGTAQTFSWTISAGGSGVVTFTATAAGSTCGSIGVLGAASASATLQTPPLLVAATAVFPAAPCLGQPFLLTLTVTNTGQAGATNVQPAPWFVTGTGGIGSISGPNPPAPAFLNGGGWVGFTYTLTASSAGSVSLSTSVTGLDQNSGLALLTAPVLAGPQTLVTAGALVPAVSVSPATVSAGQWVTVALTVTNSGGSDVTGLTATGFVAPGAGLVTVTSGPAGGVTLAAGAAQTFAWTFSTSGAGTAVFSLTATGVTACGGLPVAVTGTGTGALTIQAPAALAVSVVAFPSPRSLGQTFMVTATVTNTGGATATGFTLAPFLLAGTGTATYDAGPNPALPGSLAGGASATFTWTYTGSVAGTVVFTTTATAADANTGFGVTSGPAVSNAEQILPPAALDVALVAFPSTRNVGQGFLVTLTVTNTGGTTILDVTASAFIASGTATLGAGAGPAPAFPVTLAPGASVTFTWTESGTSAGAIWLTTTVFGTDQVSGNPVEVGPVVSNVVLIQAPAALVAAFNPESVDFPTTQMCVDGQFMVKLTVTNEGQAAASIDAVTPFLGTGTAAVTLVSGPTPAMPWTLPGGSATRFTWTLQTMQPGAGILTVTVTGTDLNSGAPLAIGPVLSSTVDTYRPGLMVSISHDPPAPSIGDLVTYTILVTNTGTGQWRYAGMTILCTLPPGLVAVSTTSFIPPYVGGLSGSGMGWLGGFTDRWAGYQHLQPGETTTVMLEAMVCGAGPFTLTAQAVGVDCVSQNQISSPDTLTPGPAVPVLGVSMTHGPATPGPGGPVTYRIVATNVSQVSVFNMRIVSTLPAGVTFAGQAVTAPGAGFPVWNGATSGAMEWSVSNIPLMPGESVTVTIDATVCGAGFYTATPWFGAESPCGPHEASDPSDAFTVAGGPPLAVVLDHEPATPGLRGPVTYRILATNTSAATLPGLLIVDTLPPEFTYGGHRYDVGFGLMTWNGASSGAIAWQLGSTFYPGQSVTVWIDGTVCAPGLISNTAWVAGSSACGTVEAASPPDAFAAPATPPLAVSLAHEPTQPGPGGPVTYRILATNTSAATLPGLLIVDTLPAGVIFGGQRTEVPNFGFATWNGATSGALAWSLVGTIYPAQSVTVWIDGTVCGTGLISSTAWAGGQTVCGVIEASDPADAFVMNGPAALTIAGSHEPAQPAPGGPVTYRIVATNATAATITGLLIVDTLPAGVTFVGERTEVPSGFISWNGATSGPLAWRHMSALVPGASVTVWIDGIVCGTGTIGNTVWAGADLVCGPVEAADPADAFVMAGPPSLGLAVSHTPAAPDPGTGVTYRLLATNTSGATLSNLLIVNTLPAGVTFTGQNAEVPNAGLASWNGATSGALAWSVLGTIYPAQSVTVWVDGTVCGTGLISTTGWAGSVIGCGPIQGSDPADAFTPTGPPMSVGLSVVRTPAAPLPGEPVAYMIVVENTGSATIDDLIVTDTLPAEVTFTGWEQSAKLTPFVFGPGRGWSLSPADDFFPGEVLTATIYGTAACVSAVLGNTVYVSGGISCVTTSAQVRDDATVAAPGTLTAVVTAPAIVGTGNLFAVALTVTNTGGSPVAGVTATAFAGPGGPLAVPVSGPVPAGPVVLIAGAAQTFVWTFSAAGGGTVSFTLTAAGTTCAGSANRLAAGTVAVLLQTPARLSATLTVSATTVCVGSPVIATLEVANLGQAAADAPVVAPFLTGGPGALLQLAGPEPALPGSIAGGTAVRFSWTFTGLAAGATGLSTTVTATDALDGAPRTSGPVAGPAMAAHDPGALAAALSVPAEVSVGQLFSTILTLTNTGGSGVQVTSLDLGAGPGAGLVTAPGAFLPGLPVTLGPGASAAFVWTFTATGAGAVTFTVTAAGGDLCGPRSATAVAGLAVVTPAALAVSVVAAPSPRSPGQTFGVSVTVTNTGGATATGFTLAPFLLTGTGAAVFGAGPLPALPPALAGGAAATFIWTYTATGLGTVAFTTTATAVDANTGAPVTSGPATSNAELILPPAALEVALVAYPSAANTGQSFVVTLTVTNSGGTGLLDLTASAFVATGPVGPGAGPAPAFPVALAPGASITFTWTESGTSAGTLWFSTTIYGTDQVSGNPVVIGPVVSNSVVVQLPAALAASFAVAPAQVSVGQSFLATLTITNTGQATATGVDAASFVVSGSGGTGAALGPTPSAPVTIGGGGAITFTWTLSASSAGSVWLTTTVTGTDANDAGGLTAAPVVSPAVTIQAPAALVAALTAAPSPRTIGQTFQVSLTVTNTGQAAAGPLDVPAFLPTGTGGATFLGGPVPAVPYASLAGGAAVTFVWTYSATASGAVAFTATVNGADLNSGATLTSGPVTTPSPVVIQTPASLTAAVTGLPATLSVGQSVLVTVTVTNTGQATATAVDPGAPSGSGTGGLGAIVGPLPVPPVAIPGGTAVTFTFTVTAASAGSVALTATVTGLDANSSAALTTGPVSSPAGAIQTPAALVAAARAFPVTRNTGQSFFVTVTVTNTGQATAGGVTPAAFVVSGSGGATVTAGPEPAAPASLGGGNAITWTWTLSASSSGLVWLTTTVSGTDGNAGWALSTGPTVSNTVAIQSAAALAARVDAFPATRNAGQPFLVTISLTNTGGAVATGLALAPFRVSGAGGASPSAGPTPPLPGSLAGGASVTLTWTFTGGPGLGFLDLSLTVSGTDANSLLPLSTGPAASATVLIQSPAALVAAPAVSNTTLCLGDSFFLTLTVTNTGQAAATGVAPAPVFQSGAGLATIGSGPAPASVPSLAGGSAVTFTWTLTAATAGALSLSTTVAGLDANAGTIAASPVVAVAAGLNAPGALAVRWSLPATVSTGQAFGITVTVTNTGGAALGGVLPVISAGAGASPVSGPVPAGPVTLAPGAAQTFAWTYAGASSGTPAFTATVTGTDLCALRTAAASATLAVQTAALLSAALSLSPDPSNIGSNFLVMLTVTNAGQAAATGVVASAFAGTGPGAAVPVGPPPAFPVTIAGGAAVVFTWTANGTTPGTFGLTTTVTGLDANALASLTTGPVTRTMMLTTGAALTAQASLVPQTVSVGQAITVSFTVSNTAGGNDATNLTPLIFLDGTAGLTLTGTPPPGPFTIPGGTGQTYVWTFNTTSAGSLAFSLTATAQDAFTLAPLFAAASATGLTQTPASLTAGMTLSTTLVFVGDTMLVVVSAANGGQATAAGVLPPALGITGGGVSVAAAPAAVAASIAGGASITWSWTLVGIAPGTAAFTVTVAGTDANSGTAVGAVAGAALPLRVATLGLTAVSLAAGPAVLGLDRILTLVLSVSNTGTLPAPGILPQASWFGDGLLVPVSGPAPAGAALAPGQSVAFTWTYRTMRGGTVTFNASAASSTGANTGTVTSAPVTIQEAGGSLADAVVYPDPYRPADAIGGTLKFRRMPPFTKVRIYTVAAEVIAELEAGAIGLVEWNGRNTAGVRVTPGIYFWTAESPAGERRVGKFQVAP